MPWKLLVIAKQFQSTFRSLLDCTHNVFNNKKGDFQEDLGCSRRLLYCKIFYISRTLNFEFLANVFSSFPWQRGIFPPFKSFQCLVKSKPLGSLSTKGQTISEWIYEVIVSPKIRTKNCQDFCPPLLTRALHLCSWHFISNYLKSLSVHKSYFSVGMHLYLMILQIRDKIIFKNHLQCAIVIFTLHFYPPFASFYACQISCMIMHF